MEARDIRHGPDAGHACPAPLNNIRIKSAGGMEAAIRR